MIHYGDYYSIFDKDKILNVLDKIDQNSLWMFHQYFIWYNQIIPRPLGQYTDTPKYIKALSGSNISHVGDSEG